MGNRQSGKSRYSAAVHAEILRHLRNGAFKKHAAEAAGISHDALEQWIAWGKEGREPYVEFAADVLKAIADDAVRNQTIISKAAAGEHDGDWKAAAWNLVKKHPKLYGEMARGHELPTKEKPFSPWKHATPDDDAPEAN